MRTSYQSTHRPSGMLSQEFTSSFRLCKQSANSLTDIICFFWRSLAKLFCTARNDNSFWTSGPNSRWHSRGVLRLAASAFPLSRCARGTGCSASARATRSKLEWSCSDCVTSDVRQANTCATMHDKLYKSSLCDRLGAYCRTTWLLTLWQGKDKNLALTLWQSLQPLCDNLKNDCATREVQTAEHTGRQTGRPRLPVTMWECVAS